MKNPAEWERYREEQKRRLAALPKNLPKPPEPLEPEPLKPEPVRQTGPERVGQCLDGIRAELIARGEVVPDEAPPEPEPAAVKAPASVNPASKAKQAKPLGAGGFKFKIHKAYCVHALAKLRGQECAKAVWQILWEHSWPKNDDGRARLEVNGLSGETLALWTGFKIRSVWQGLDVLEQMGLIVRKRQGKNGRLIENTYFIHGKPREFLGRENVDTEDAV